MTAICDSCSWTGKSTQVRDGGRCPDCGESIRYASQSLQGVPRLNLREFLPRAAKALRAIGAEDNDEVVESAIDRIESGQSLAPVSIAILLKVVLRRADAITDQAVIDFATMNARGY